MINLDRNQEAGVSCLMHAACARIRLVWGEAGFFERTLSRLRELWDMLAKEPISRSNGALDGRIPKKYIEMKSLDR